MYQLLLCIKRKNGLSRNRIFTSDFLYINNSEEL